MKVTDQHVAQTSLLPAFRNALAMTRSDIQAVPAARAALRAAADICRDTLAGRWAATQAEDARRGPSSRRVHYLSMEFLMGRALSNALAALGLADDLRKLLAAEGMA